MRILFFDKKQGTAKLLVETLEDLWHLENILEDGDKIGSSTTRIVKFGDKEEKKPVFITISLEEIEFSKSVNRLRLRGKILSGTPEDFVQIGRYHTIDVEQEDTLLIEKEWKSFQIKRLHEAEKERKKPLIKIIAMDEEKAITAVLRSYGVEYGPEIRNRGSKRGDDYEEQTQRYYSEIFKYIKDSNEKILVAGPGFAKDNFLKYAKNKDAQLAKRINLDSCSYAEQSGINELLKRGVFEKLVGEQRLEKEEKLIEEFIKELNKGGLVVYGVKEVSIAITSGALSELLVLDELLRKDKNVQDLVETAERLKTKLTVFSKDGNPGAKLSGFGGIAGFLRFRI